MTQEQETKFKVVSKQLRDGMIEQNEVHDDFMLRGLKLGIVAPVLGLCITELSNFTDNDKFQQHFLGPIKKSELLNDEQLKFLEVEISKLLENYVLLYDISGKVDAMLSEVAPIQDDQVESLEVMYQEIMSYRMNELMGGD